MTLIPLAQVITRMPLIAPLAVQSIWAHSITEIAERWFWAGKFITTLPQLDSLHFTIKCAMLISACFLSAQQVLVLIKLLLPVFHFYTYCRASKNQSADETFAPISDCCQIPSPAQNNALPAMRYSLWLQWWQLYEPLHGLFIFSLSCICCSLDETHEHCNLGRGVFALSQAGRSDWRMDCITGLHPGVSARPRRS